MPASELELIQPESEFPEVKAEQVRADELSGEDAGPLLVSSDGLSEIEPKLIPVIPESEKNEYHHQLEFQNLKKNQHLTLIMINFQLKQKSYECHYCGDFA